MWQNYVCGLFSLLPIDRKTELFSFALYVWGRFSGSCKDFHTLTICTYRFNLCWSLIMQLVYGRNERESIVKTSPQSSLLLLFSVKGMHHRAGSAECLRLSVWHSKLKTNQTDIALNTAFIVSPYLEMFTSSWWLTEVGRRDVSHFSCKRLFRSERSRLSGCCLVKLAVLSVLLRFCEYSVFLFKVLLAFHIILAGF